MAMKTKKVKKQKLAKKDYDGDGKVESAAEEYFGSRDKAIKKASSKKKKKKIQKEASEITSFISCISNKNFAQAHKYLRSLVEKKIQQRISTSLNKPLF